LVRLLASGALTTPLARGANPTGVEGRIHINQIEAIRWALDKLGQDLKAVSEAQKAFLVL
jgi:hypothetical protein